MNITQLKEDWLLSNALVAFLGALVLAQQWQMPEGTIRLLFVFEVPDYTGLVIFLLIAVLFVLSLFLALASVVAKLRSRALGIGKDFSRILGIFTWIAFILSWLSSIPALPSDQWWSVFLIVGGLALIFFIPVRMVVRS